MISVSIIIPVYNVSRYIGRCLRSVMGQTYAGPIECILVDDRGTDDSMARARGIIDAYDGPVKFTILTHNRNLGPSEARNTGIRAAGGDYLLFLDSDDAFTLQAVERMAGMAEKYPGVDMVTSFFYFSPDLEPSAEIKGWEYTEGNEKVKRMMLRTGTLPDFAHNKLVRKKFILENSLFFRPGIVFEDNLWNWHVAKKIRSIAVVKEGTYVYFKNPGSILNSRNLRKTDDRLLVALEKCGTIDIDSAPDAQLRHAAGFLLDAETEVRYNFDGAEKESRLTCVREGVKSLAKANSGRAFDLRTFLSLLFFRAEFALGLDIDSRLYWLLHRAAKMTAVCPRPGK